MTVYLVKFDSHNSDSWVDVYANHADALKAAAHVATEHAGDVEVTKAFDAGDYERVLKLSAKLYEVTSDHYIEVEAAEVK